MNQILNETGKKSQKQYSKSILKKYIYLFYISIIICIITLFFYIFQKSKSTKNDKISKTLASNFAITSLYSNTDENYIASSLIQEYEISSPFVIGIIKIDKINLFYPILSETTNETLKIAPCKLYGCNPNSIGNFCIAGHNYVNNKQFSNLYKLEIDDIITIYDLAGNFIDYKVFEKIEVESDDLSCISQETNNTKQITLITCNNVTGKRVIVKAIEI